MRTEEDNKEWASVKKENPKGDVEDGKRVRSRKIVAGKRMVEAREKTKREYLKERMRA